MPGRGSKASSPAPRRIIVAFRTRRGNAGEGGVVSGTNLVSREAPSLSAQSRRAEDSLPAHYISDSEPLRGDPDIIGNMF